MNSLEDLDHLASKVAQEISSGDILLLDGPVGVGKTTFVNLLLQELHSPDSGSSPSYALHKRYSCPQGQIDHLDLYRLESLSSFESLDPWSLMEENFLTIVEWPFQVPVVWPEEAVLLTFEFKGDCHRLATFKIGKSH